MKYKYVIVLNIVTDKGPGVSEIGIERAFQIETFADIDAIHQDYLMQNPHVKVAVIANIIRLPV